MADQSKMPPLTPSSIRAAHARIKSYIHQTPLLTSKTLDRIVNAPAPEKGAPSPKLRLWFKCENQQKIGAFKARGAHHAVLRLIGEMGIEKVRSRGVVTHSSGNHAQALALAAHTFRIPAYIVMPRISTPSKIAGTQLYTNHVIFSGSTSQEREAAVEKVIAETGAILVPPYDHPDIILGQGTTGLEMEAQFKEAKRADEEYKVVENGAGGQVNGNVQPEQTYQQQQEEEEEQQQREEPYLDAILVPLGGGGLLGGIATYFSPEDASPPDLQQQLPVSAHSSDSSAHPRPIPKTYIFGCEPSHQSANDAQFGLASNPPKRIDHVQSLTIADGLRTPVGVLNWTIVSNPSKVQAVYSVTEQQIKNAMRLVLERLKVVVEPSGAVGLAVALYNAEWRGWVVERQREEEMRLGLGPGEGRVWDIGVVFSGGNTTVEAIAALFGEKEENNEGLGERSDGEERAKGTVGVTGETKVEDVAG